MDGDKVKDQLTGAVGTGIAIGAGIIGLSIPLTVMKKAAEEMNDDEPKKREVKKKTRKKEVELNLPKISPPQRKAREGVYEMPALNLPEVNINIPTMGGIKRIKY